MNNIFEPLDKIACIRRQMEKNTRNLINENSRLKNELILWKSGAAMLFIASVFAYALVGG